MAQEVAVVNTRPAAELAHRIAELRSHQRVHHDGGTAACLLDGDVQVLDVLHTGVPDLLERLIGELRLECEHEALSRLTRRVRDDVELDRDAIAGVAAHGRRLAPESSYDRSVGRLRREQWLSQS
jgi:hypothetical protein